VFRRLPAISVLAGVAVFVLCACDASGGSATSASTSGGARAGTSDVTANPATPAATATPAPTATPAHWVLSMPASINGEQRLTDPDSQTRAELRRGIQQAGGSDETVTVKPATVGPHGGTAICERRSTPPCGTSGPPWKSGCRRRRPHDTRLRAPG
jgi:hypothetical protein